MNEAYTFNDVLIEPRYSEIGSRSEVDLSTKVGSVSLSLPIISANMKDITGPKMAIEVIKMGGLGILHRFNTTDRAVADFIEVAYDNNSRGGNLPGVSIGVKEDDKRRFELLYEAGARIFCIDVAHGHHIHVKNMLKWINEQIFVWDRSARGKINLIAGNIATPEAYLDMILWGADAVKVGIGPGSKCTTRRNTGVGVPQLYALERIYNASINHPSSVSIIADGGIGYVGDIAKALKFADAVMIGSAISGTAETPGSVFRNEENEFYKVYGGSASGENKGTNQFVEGVVKTVKFKGKVKYILHEIEQGLQSAFSYVGARTHLEYQAYCKFNHISVGAQKESRM